MSSKQPEQPIIAYELHSVVDTPLEVSPFNRDWMDRAHMRHPYRCLPLVIANQAGWILRSTAGFRAYWYGGPAKEDVELQFDGPVDNRIVSHFGSGVITFTIPYLFRTPLGINLWVKGPSNFVKDGVQALEGVVETDWLASTFTMNWKITRPCEWVRFDKGEPFCMIVPVPRGLAESLVPQRHFLETNPELMAQYQAWEASRRGFLADLSSRDPEAIKRGWQKDYFQGKTPDGKDFESHQTRLELREFEQIGINAAGIPTTQRESAPTDQPGQQG
jgi:hypothetical protein